MTVMWVDVRRREMLDRPLLGGKLNTRESLSTYCRVRWPHATAKWAAHEWDLSLDEARGIVAARASQATIDKILEHGRGGWPVALSVLAGVIGHGVGSYFAAEAERARDEAEQRKREADALAAVERVASRSFAPVVAAAWSGLAGGLGADRPGNDVSAGDRVAPVGGRKAGRS